MGIGRSRTRALVDLVRRVREASEGRVPFRNEFTLLVVSVARRYSASERLRRANGVA